MQTSGKVLVTMRKKMINICYASDKDINYIVKTDSHLKTVEIKEKVRRKEIIIVRNEKGAPIGLLRFNLFWDEIPFMNLIIINSRYRRKGIGKKLVEFWEKEMRNKGYKKTMTSTLSNEQAQHFYRKLGYRDAGSLLLDKEPSEIIFVKDI